MLISCLVLAFGFSNSSISRLLNILFYVKSLFNFLIFISTFNIYLILFYFERRTHNIIFCYSCTIIRIIATTICFFLAWSSWSSNLSRRLQFIITIIWNSKDNIHGVLIWIFIFVFYSFFLLLQMATSITN